MSIFWFSENESGALVLEKLQAGEVFLGDAIKQGGAVINLGQDKSPNRIGTRIKTEEPPNPPNIANLPVQSFGQMRNITGHLHVMVKNDP